MEAIKQQQLELIESLQMYIPRLQIGIEEVHNAINIDDQQKMYELVIQIVEGYEWVLQAVQMTHQIYSEAIVLGEIVEPLRELVDAFENNDRVLMLDILNYEIKEQLEHWEHIINIFMQSQQVQE